MYQANVESKTLNYRDRILRIIYERAIQQLSIDAKIPLFELDSALIGKSQLRLDQIESICRALNCTPSDIIKPRLPMKDTPSVKPRYQNQKDFEITKPFLKVREAANVYNIGRNLIYSAIHNKELKAYKPNCRDYLIKVTEIEAWIQSKPI
ncbi:helix-turn-helix domain-containing protein [Pseudobacteroides cellulosolvens]|uniref:DNA binding domain protein, excisionase family n=1 Tax=Pseudobacteroides cellulosolvens ATCC 35603 = DSM 2933 TaxID=398512 RepID=A0A0L6JWI9_9FIRM|nr:helix-turn-helix domain-containing protein [Pseudobacteroides cellulosolvens]KNY30206.1 DNA binding domain protein, excisionase family [Pseudobacteroides cellulosolvens ATCC 35603 = DSM 2933]